MISWSSEMHWHKEHKASSSSSRKHTCRHMPHSLGERRRGGMRRGASAEEWEGMGLPKSLDDGGRSHKQAWRWEDGLLTAQSSAGRPECPNFRIADCQMTEMPKCRMSEFPECRMTERQMSD